LPDDIKPENESTFEIEIIARSVNDIETLHKQYLECMHDHGAGKIRISISGRRKSISERCAAPTHGKLYFSNLSPVENLRQNWFAVNPLDEET